MMLDCLFSSLFSYCSIESFQIERQEPGSSFVMTNSSEEYTVDQEPWYIDRSDNFISTCLSEPGNWGGDDEGVRHTA